MIRLAMSMHAVLYSCLRVYPCLKKSSTITFLGLLAIVEHVMLGLKSQLLLVIHLLAEFGLTFEIFDAFIGPFFLFIELVNSILKLLLLFFFYLLINDGIHHNVIWLLAVHSAQTLIQVVVLLLSSYRGVV